MIDEQRFGEDCVEKLVMMFDNLFEVVSLLYLFDHSVPILFDNLFAEIVDEVFNEVDHVVVGHIGRFVAIERDFLCRLQS